MRGLQQGCRLGVRETNCDEETSSRTFVCERGASKTECFGGSCYDIRKKHSGNEDVHALYGYVVEIDTQEEQNIVKEQAGLLARKYYPDSGHSVWLSARDDDLEGNLLEKRGHCNWNRRVCSLAGRRTKRRRKMGQLVYQRRTLLYLFFY